MYLRSVILMYCLDVIHSEAKKQSLIIPESPWQVRDQECNLL